MDPNNKPKGPSPHYSLYQREIFKNGGTHGICNTSLIVKGGTILILIPCTDTPILLCSPRRVS